MCRYYGFGDAEKDEPLPSLWQSFKEAIWGLMAPVLILGGMRSGWFTPTEAAVMAVIYGLFVGIVIYRSITVRDIYEHARRGGRDLRRHPDRRGPGQHLRLGVQHARHRRPDRAGDRRRRAAANTAC